MPIRLITDIKDELVIAQETFREANEDIANGYGVDWHKLRKHTDLLESLLRDYEIEFPVFYS